ncbi:chemotaxis protein CheB [Allohahella marinimesophila]|uniref:histidine kinase n=1 Tax=Allohahella marinimesophila TaxID=1054972 RepID=A0ABP7PQR6_9GAMM
MPVSEQPVAGGQEAFHIVAIGASAGGLEPLEKFFAAVPDLSGMAFVVIQHLSPDFKSQMEQLLSRKTKLHVQPAGHEMEVAPNEVYLLPPGKSMTISAGRLMLLERDPADQPALPVDTFFSSLARELGHRSVAVVLSGTGSDGSRGVVEIARAGGLVITQSEESAAFDGMPLSAVATGVSSLSLAPEHMPDALVRFVRSGLSPDRFVASTSEISLDEFRPVFTLLQDAFGIDFGLYKTGTVGRRIERRMLLTGRRGSKAYLDFINEHPEEIELLYKDLLVGVTRFFRDSVAFQVLEKQIIPRLVSQFLAHNTDASVELRLWCAGCATGEEPYSMAMLLFEQFKRMHEAPRFKVFASDVHQSSVRFASAGLYGLDSVRELSESRQQSFFVQDGEHFRVIPELRKLVSFAAHDVIRDAPFTSLDFVSCRNLLIYFQPEVQRKVISLFHFGLKPQGILMLGSSESLGELADEFDVIDKRARLFRKRRDVRLRIPDRGSLRARTEMFHAGSQVPSQRNQRDSERVQTALFESLLQDHMPPTFIIDEQGELMHIFGGGEQFLIVHAGRVSRRLVDMLDGNVRSTVATAINSARELKKEVRYKGFRIDDNQKKSRRFELVVRPCGTISEPPTLMAVSFRPSAVAAIDLLDDVTVDIDEMARQHIVRLEAELQASQEDLQATIEELETTNEELQASNEELVSSNEELQSTNEELQSLNQELYTVNLEFQNKIHQLTEANDDMYNLMANTRIGVLFIGEDLRIRRFTPEAARIFDLVPDDVGRSLEVITRPLERENLEDDIREVISGVTEIELGVYSHKNTSYLLRLLPYREQKSQRITGTVLMLVDISSLRRAQFEADKFRQLSDRSPHVTLLLDLNGCISYANSTLLNFTGTDLPTLSKSHVRDTLGSFNGSQPLAAFEQAIAEGSSSCEAQVINRSGGGPIPVEVSMSRIRFDDGEHSILVLATDLRSRLAANFELFLRERALEVSQAGIVITDARSGLITYVNAGFYDTTGYTREEALGRNCRFLQGEDTDPVSIHKVRQAIEARRSVRVTLKNYRKDGSAFWNDLSITPVKNELGEITHFIGCQFDVSASRKREQKASATARRIRLLLDSTAEGIVGVDAAGRCTFCNQSAVNLLGYSSTELLVGSKVHAAIQHTSAEGEPMSEAESLIMQSLSSGQMVDSDAEVLWRRDGQPVPVELWCHPQTDEKGKVVGAVITFVDITERKQHQQQLEAMTAEARAANQAKSEFLAKISHELRTPLTAIAGFAELLRLEIADPRALDQINVIRRNSTYLEELLNDLLDLSKVEAGKMVIEPEDFELMDLIMDILAVASPRSDEKNLALRFEILEQVPRRVNTDAVRLKQILDNLIGNAIKFTGDGSITVTVGVSSISEVPADMADLFGHLEACSAHNFRMLEFTVKDTGIGIPEEFHGQLFMPFSRGSGEEVRKAKGTGLGLSISKNLAERMAGDLRFESTPGLGSLFCLRLPVLIHPDGATLSAGLLDAVAVTMEADAQRPLLPIRALVADDNDDIRSYLASAIESCGGTVVQAQNGEEAVEAFMDSLHDESAIDIVLMDMQMPRMDGRTAVHELRRRGCKQPIIAITAAAMKGDREMIIGLGCDDYLAKPINIGALLRRIEFFMQNKGGEAWEARLHRARQSGFQLPHERMSSSKRKILVVDDHIDVTSAMQALLTAHGFEVEVANTGFDAVHRLRRFRPDALLLDISLPDMDGFEVMRALEEEGLRHEALFCVATTGHTQTEMKSRAVQSGFDAYVEKPITMKVLLSLLEKRFSQKSP